MASGCEAGAQGAGTSDGVVGWSAPSQTHTILICKPSEYELKYDAWRKSQDFCDVTVILNGQRFPVHKIVLCARSCVFERLLLSGSKESITSEIFLKGIEIPIFEQLLEYVYTGVVFVTEDTIVPLLQAAHLYLMDVLVNALDEVIADQVTEENCMPLWRFGEQFQLEAVTDRCAKFTSQNLDQMENSVDIPSRYVGSLKKNGWSDTKLFMLFCKWVEGKKPDQERATLLKLINLQRVKPKVGKMSVNSKNMTTKEKDLIVNRLSNFYFEIRTTEKVRLCPYGSSDTKLMELYNEWVVSGKPVKQRVALLKLVDLYHVDPQFGMNLVNSLHFHTTVEEKDLILDRLSSLYYETKTTKRVRSCPCTSKHSNQGKNPANISSRYVSLKESGCTDTILMETFYKLAESKGPVEERVTLLKLVNLQNMDPQFGMNMVNSLHLPTVEEKDLIIDRLSRFFFEMRTTKKVRPCPYGGSHSRLVEVFQNWVEVEKPVEQRVALLKFVDLYHVDPQFGMNVVNSLHLPRVEEKDLILDRLSMLYYETRTTKKVRSCPCTSKHLYQAENTTNISSRYASLKENGCTDTMIMELFYKLAESKGPVEERVTLLKLVNLQSVDAQFGMNMVNSQNLPTVEEKEFILNRLSKFYFEMKTTKKARPCPYGGSHTGLMEVYHKWVGLDIPVEERIGLLKLVNLQHVDPRFGMNVVNSQNLPTMEEKDIILDHLSKLYYEIRSTRKVRSSFHVSGG